MNIIAPRNALWEEIRALIQEWLTEEEIAEVNRVNATPEYAEHGFDALHNVCDGNQIYLDAFQNVYGRECDFSDEDMAIMNDAIIQAAKHPY